MPLDFSGDFQGLYNPKYVILDWEPPESDGCSPLQGYKIYKGVKHSGRIIWWWEKDTTNTYYHDYAIDIPHVYYYYIVAKNTVGSGPPTDTVQVKCIKGRDMH